MGKPLELSGQQFGRLTAIRKCGVRHAKVLWECRCNCGAHVSVTTGNLRSGNSKSCGCVAVERISKLNRTHGASRTPEYNAWLTMRNRCHNPRSKSFGDYGARGITVCNRWRKDFGDFIKDMGPRPSPRHSVERRNNDKGYTPENCFWATKEVQANNARSNVRIEYRGVSLTVAQWGRRTGIKACTLRARARRGLSPQEILKD